MKRHPSLSLKGKKPSITSIGYVFYRIVMKTLKEMSSTRPCYRQISGVLVEGTVESMIPHLEQQEANVFGIDSSIVQCNYFPT